MKVSELHDIAAALGRFSTTRETAIGPESKIGVQIASGRLKLIAGQAEAVMVVDIQPAEGKYSYFIEARPFLQASKALTGRGTVEIVPSESGLSILTPEGGRVTLKAMGELANAEFPKDLRA